MNDDYICGDAFCNKYVGSVMTGSRPNDGGGGYCNIHTLPHPICEGSLIKCNPCSNETYKQSIATTTGLTPPQQDDDEVLETVSTTTSTSSSSRILLL